MAKSLPQLVARRYERTWVGSSRMKSILALTHPTAVLIFGFVTLLLAPLAAHGIPPLGLFILLPLAMMFGQAAIGVFNEVFDYELDRAVKPWRALPAGMISRKAACTFGFLCAVLGFGCAFSLSMPSALVYCLGIGTGILYSTRLKNSVLSGLPYLIAYPLLPIWVWVSVGAFQTHLLALYPLALPLALAIHLVNQLRDFDDDQRMGLHSLVQILGKTRAIRLCYFLLLASPLALWLMGLRVGTRFALALVVVCSLTYWSVIGSYLYARHGDTNPQVFRDLFKRLQVTGPLMLVCCLLLLDMGP